jgi:serine-type D-Ala-D-Ala carboxypeptidase/endopeptidase
MAEMCSMMFPPTNKGCPEMLNSKQKKTKAIAVFVAALTLAPVLAFAQITSDADLERAVKNRFEGDRVARCLAVAYIGEKTSKAFVCSDEKRAQKISASTTFEIGSITKTMTSYLVADLIDQGKMKLDDPLEKYLPAGSVVPKWEGKPVTLQHIVTHTSGLPRMPGNMEKSDPGNPYSHIKPNDLLNTLRETKLTAEPGTKFEYSNFAMMVLTIAVADTAQQDFETLLKNRLFDAVGMRTAYINKPPANVQTAQGHNTSRKAVPAWTLATDLAGVGMVHASLDDMVAYARAAMGKPDTVADKKSNAMRAASLLATAQKSLYKKDQTDIGMNWSRRTLDGGVNVVEHGGGTGGFSSYLVIDRTNLRAVVMLSDTSGAGIGKFADSLLDSKVDPGKARKNIAPDAKLLASLVGDYNIDGQLPATLRTREGKLFIQAKGQPEFEMGHDSSGDFYILDFDAVLKREVSGDAVKLTLLQGGAAMPFTRRDPAAKAEEDKNTFNVPVEKLAGYQGVYPLLPGLKLTVAVKGDTLTAQGTGQGAFPLKAVSEDHFTADDVGIKVWFKRAGDGKVNAMRFLQGPNDVTVNRE